MGRGAWGRGNLLWCDSASVGSLRLKPACPQRQDTLPSPVGTRAIIKVTLGSLLAESSLSFLSWFRSQMGKGNTGYQSPEDAGQVWEERSTSQKGFKGKPLCLDPAPQPLLCPAVRGGH